MIKESYIEQYAEESFELAKQFVKEMCAIPAPSGNEGQRAQYVKKWLLENFADNVEIDEALNVVCSYGVTDDNPLIVMMAHTDTVFPDLTPMPFTEKDGIMYCPGVTDDTANLAVLLTSARYIMKNKLPMKYGFLFVANSCEEGLGNLKGSRFIMNKYGSRVRQLITVDGTNFGRIVNRAVGSHRYKVTVRTEGGHSYNMFGNRNAIACLSSMITSFYSVKVPKNGDSKTTYNVGLINGGTSVNTIAQEASMLFEYRSDDSSCLEQMKNMFEKMTEAYRATGIEVEVEKIGDRPSGFINDGNPVNEELISYAVDSIKRITCCDVVFNSGSTDANIPLSMGIPAICITGAQGGKTHTREEYLETDSLKSGIRLILDFISHYCA